MTTELEEQRLRAEIAKLEAETESLKRPSTLQTYVAIAALVGALSGIAAVGQMAMQLRTLQFDLLHKRYQTETDVEETNKRAEAARLEYTRITAQLQTTRALLKSSNESLGQYQQRSQEAIQAATVSNATQGAAHLRGTIQLFMRPGFPLGADCAAILGRQGYLVSDAERVAQGPMNDEVKYFWPEDAPEARRIGGYIKSCGLDVPDQNFVQITGDPDSANSPKRYFEVWSRSAR